MATTVHPLAVSDRESKRPNGPRPKPSSQAARMRELSAATRPPEQRELLSALAAFLPLGAPVLNLGFDAELFDECLARDCRPLPAVPARGAQPTGPDALQRPLPNGCYVVTPSPLTADRAGAALLRAVAAARAHLLCVCEDGTEDARGARAGALPPALLDTIGDSGCRVRASRAIAPGRHVLSVCARPADEGPRPFEVVTLSWAGLPNFGDRLGIHLINQLLPAHATVRHEYTARDTLCARPIDVLVLGLGFSVFQPLLTDPLLRVVDHSARVIGIFGTQYRRSIDRARLSALLRKIDVWYARYLEDLLLFGGDCRGVHLGDWLINAFPMAHPQHRPALAETLVVGPEIMLEEVSLDRLIERIQMYRRVVSARLHPLLCALTSAEEVAYYDQRDEASGESTGKFRSMLLDVFGVHHPSGAFFAVDRAAVRDYRRHVQTAMQALATDLLRAGAGASIRSESC